LQWGGITVVVVVRDIMHDDKRMEGIEREREGRKKKKSGWRRMKRKGGTFHPADDGGRGRPLFGATTDSGHGGNIRAVGGTKRGRIYNKQRRP
jgi:hypothetical protein